MKPGLDRSSGLDRSRDSRNIGQQQQRFQREEFRSSVRALLMTPLMSPEHDDFLYLLMPVRVS